MSNPVRIPPSLRASINQVASRYQCARIMRCWIRFGFFTFSFVVLGVFLLKIFESYQIPSVWTIATALVVELAAFIYYVVFPLREPISKNKIALYIEERFPDLESRIVSAVSFESEESSESSSWMLERFFEDTDLVVDKASISELLDLDLLTKLFIVTACFLMLSLAVVTLFHRLWLPDFSFERTEQITTTVSVYKFTVEPGNARVRIGDNQTILCKTTVGERAVSLLWRSGGDDWQTATMSPAVTDGVYHHTFLDIQSDIEYAVQLSASRSDAYLLKTWSPPKLESIDVVYHYPEYLNKDPLETPNAGSLSAIEGTRVELTAWVNKELRSAVMVFDSSQTISLHKDSDISWKASFTPDQNDRFSIHLTDREGETSEFSPEYDIVLHPDNPPKIELVFPRQDMEATMLEEIPIEFKVGDDFGIKDYGILYVIAGRDRVTIPIHNEDESDIELITNYWFHLEELNLEPGDLITWTAWANDRKPGRDEYETMGDPFFIEIRPFRRQFENAISNAGANQQQQQNGENGGDRSALDQKEIIIATWNLRRQIQSLDDASFFEKRGSIIEAQKRLLDEATDPERAAQTSPVLLRQLTDAMKKALERLDASDWPNSEERLSQAIVEEQKAYRLLLKMRPDTTQVQQQMARSNSASASANQSEINELEIERKRNFYEEENRIQQQMENTDEALNKLNDLTQRQKAINDELSKLISEAKEETPSEELKRQLERLQEEERRNLERLDEMESSLAMNDRRNSNTDEALQSLNDVRQQMNRGLEQMDNEQIQEARASGSRALNTLDRMEEEIKQLSREGAAQQMAGLQEKMNDLLEREKDIIEQLENLKKEEEIPSLTLDPNFDEKKRELNQKKNALAEDFVETIASANEIAERSRSSQEMLSRQLGDWMRETSGLGIYEDIQSERRTPLIRYGIWDSALERENQILDKLNRSAEALERVANSMTSSDLESMQVALERLNELINSERNPSQSAAGSIRAATNVRSASSIAMSGSPSNKNPNGESQQDGVQNSQSQNENNTESSHRQNGSSQNQNSQNQNDGQNQAGQFPNGRQFNQSGNSGGGFQWPTGEEIRSPQSMRRFVESDYREWLESLRNTEGMLPNDNRYRESISRIQDGIEDMRGDFNREGHEPKYDLFLERVANPLIETAKGLEKEIRSILSQEEFVLLDEGSVPDRYRDRVAEYFKNVSEIGITHE